MTITGTISAMDSGTPKKSTQATREELDAISNRVAVALAKRERLIKSWTASSAREKQPEKTQEELDGEDAILYRSQPPYLGVGAAVPSHFLVSDADRNNRSLRAKFFPTKGLKASKLRDAEEKAASAKRGLQNEDSEDEGGRSSLGKAKKQKITKSSSQVTGINSSKEEPEQLINKSLPTPSGTAPADTPPPIPELEKASAAASSNTAVDGEVSQKSAEELKKEKTRLRNKMKKLRKKQKKEKLQMK